MHLWLQNNPSDASLENISFTLNVGRNHFKVRCALVASSLEELSATLKKLANNELIKNGFVDSATPQNIDSPALNAVYNLTINDIQQPQSDSVYYDKLLILADLYAKGYPIDWKIIHAGESHYRIASLPGYPFNKNRYWIPSQLEQSIRQNNLMQTNQIQDSPAQLSDSHPESNAENKILGNTINYLKTIFAEKLHLSIDEISADKSYDTYGIESLIGIDIIKSLEKDFGILSKTLLYEKMNITVLADYLIKKYPKSLKLSFPLKQ